MHAKPSTENETRLLCCCAFSPTPRAPPPPTPPQCKWFTCLCCYGGLSLTTPESYTSASSKIIMFNMHIPLDQRESEWNVCAYLKLFCIYLRCDNSELCAISVYCSSFISKQNIRFVYAAQHTSRQHTSTRFYIQQNTKRNPLL